MTRRMMSGVALVVTALLSGAQGNAVSPRAAVRSPPAAGTPAPGTTERHHYMMSARVRPLLLF